MTIQQVRLLVLVLHTEKLATRRPMVEALLTKLRAQADFSAVEARWVTEHDPEALAAAPAKVSAAVSLAKGACGVPFYDDLVRNLHLKQVSNALKHHEALQQAAAAAADFDFVLVVEDDVVYGEDVAAALAGVLLPPAPASAADAWDVLFLGQPSLTAVAARQGEVQVLPLQDQLRVLPACESYVLRPAAAARLLPAFLPVRFQANVHWSWLLESQRESVVAKRTVPNLLLDGSKLGVYVSSLDPNARLLFNAEYGRLAQLARKPAGELTADELAEADRLDAGMRFRGHPDVLYLQALRALHHRADPARAKELMDAAYKLYQDNGAILNNESEFLAAYIDVHKHVQ